MKARFSKDFILVVIGQLISIFGNQIVRFALPLYLLNQTGSSVLFGTILAVSFIPMILLFPVGGIIADRVNKKNIMVILDFSTGILIILFYLLLGKIDIVPLMAITMIILFGIQGAYQPAVKASVPALVETEYIMQANSIVDVINSLSSMAGPVIGGILFSIFGLTPILYVAVFCFFASAIMEIFIHIPFEKRQAKRNIFVTGFGDLKESFNFLFKEQPVMSKATFIYASTNLLLIPLILIGVPVLITQHLGFETNTANRLYGYAQGVIAGGAVLGGLIAGVFSKKLTLKSSPFILIGCALSVLLAGVALHTLKSPFGIYIIMSIGAGLLVLLSTLFQIQIMTCFQILTPNELIGKIVSVVICVCFCASPFGQFIYGIVFEYIERGTYIPFYVAGLIMIGISIFTRRIFYGIDDLIKKTSQ
jgi:MFS family permease